MKWVRQRDHLYLFSVLVFDRPNTARLFYCTLAIGVFEFCWILAQKWFSWSIVCFLSSSSRPAVVITEHKHPRMKVNSVHLCYSQANKQLVREPFWSQKFDKDLQALLPSVNSPETLQSVIQSTDQPASGSGVQLLFCFNRETPYSRYYIQATAAITCWCNVLNPHYLKERLDFKRHFLCSSSCEGLAPWLWIMRAPLQWVVKAEQLFNRVALKKWLNVQDLDCSTCSIQTDPCDFLLKLPACFSLWNISASLSWTKC